MSSHGRGHRFEPCTTHQHLLNVINNLEDALGVFFSFKSSINTVYYYSEVFGLVLLGFAGGKSPLSRYSRRSFLLLQTVGNGGITA